MKLLETERVQLIEPSACLTCNQASIVRDSAGCHIACRRIWCDNRLEHDERAPISLTFPEALLYLGGHTA